MKTWTIRHKTRIKESRIFQFRLVKGPIAPPAPPRLPPQPACCHLSRLLCRGSLDCYQVGPELGLQITIIMLGRVVPAVLLPLLPSREILPHSPHGPLTVLDVHRIEHIQLL
jgi:hypothetical protein